MRKFINNNGFTLIEVLVAMVILSVGLLGTAALITGIINSNKLSNRITTATTLAQDKMEEIKSVSYSNAVSEIRAFLPSPDNKYEREVTVVDDSPAGNMKTVTVAVFWESSKSVSLQTILAE
ncbi:MAG: prepilin-type N-terminal cleavage/methylation domain-containing protein [Desulfobacteraceae bacterium]|nr:prepilin-type N-terminal cleavage/methylation domain-containing protein [Desulfobacteraceae bacterium]MBC2720822.1 prepilin-type N-terminal cleavage/methylation domain-containing protein [Desulfobacteraceae bacterium]